MPVNSSLPRHYETAIRFPYRGESCLCDPLRSELTLDERRIRAEFLLDAGSIGREGAEALGRYVEARNA